MKNRILNQVGSTLLEATLALSLLSIGLTGGLFLMQNATRASVNSDFSVAASEYANEKLELILADKFMDTDGDGSADGYGTMVIPGTYTDPLLPFGNTADYFTRTVVINTVDSNFNTVTADQGLKQVNVIMSWTPVGSGAASTLTVSTLLTCYNQDDDICPE